MSSSIRKFMLVPEEDMLRRLQLQGHPAEAKAAVQTQMNIEAMLRDHRTPLDVKAKEYQQLLNRYLSLRPEVQQYVQAPPPPPAPPSLEPPPDEYPLPESEPEPSPTMPIGDIAQFLPKTMRGKGERLLSFMNTNLPDIRWDSQGQLLVGQDRRPIPNSNIVDLVRKAVQHYDISPSQQRFVPGWSDFYRSLHDANVPATLTPGFKFPVISDSTTFAAARRPSRFAGAIAVNTPTRPKKTVRKRKAAARYTPPSKLKQGRLDKSWIPIYDGHGNVI